jgi:hypothetical protein
VATIASVADTKLPANYHWPSDTPENLTWECADDTVELCEALVRGS